MRSRIASRRDRTDSVPAAISRNIPRCNDRSAPTNGAKIPRRTAMRRVRRAGRDRKRPLERTRKEIISTCSAQRRSGNGRCRGRALHDGPVPHGWLVDCRLAWRLHGLRCRGRALRGRSLQRPSPPVAHAHTITHARAHAHACTQRHSALPSGIYHSASIRHRPSLLATAQHCMLRRWKAQ